MTRLTYLLGLTLLAASALPQMANAQDVTLEPGLYEYSHVLFAGGREMSADTYEECIKAGENSKTLDDFAESLSAIGTCTLSQVSMTNAAGRANIACTDTSLGMDVTGTLEANFGSDFYNVDTEASLGQFLRIQVETKIRRLGVCLADGDIADDVTPN